GVRAVGGFRLAAVSLLGTVLGGGLCPLSGWRASVASAASRRQGGRSSHQTPTHARRKSYAREGECGSTSPTRSLSACSSRPPHYLAQTGAFVAEGCREGSRSRPHRRLSVAAVEKFDAGANFAAIQWNSRRLPSLCRQYRRAARHEIDAPAEEIAHNRDLHN